MMLRRRILLQPTGELPAGFRKVEYIQSAGQQAINTGIAAADDLVCTAEVALTSAALGNNRNYVFGVSGGGIRIQYSYSAGAFLGWGSSTTSAVQFAVDTNKHTATASRQAFTLDGVTVFTPTTSIVATTVTLALFARNAGGSLTDFSNGLKMYGCTIEKAGETVRRFIPCVRIADSIAGFYDVIGKSFYRSAGSGDFLTP